MAVFVGTVVGIASSLPMAYVLFRGGHNQSHMEWGAVLSCGITPFIVLQVLMLVVNFWWHQEAMLFGLSAAVSFLASVVVAALISRPWR